MRTFPLDMLLTRVGDWLTQSGLLSQSLLIDVLPGKITIRPLK
ncbi:type I addiction module toxin, SymE family [Pectobacterium parmentieri]|nr:SymE family type I addiction module toxin [Pectobacterium parmentieri]AYH16480.1 type I addiction module toxin, SymE family [Pectobacterium parmentieri]QHQ17982.1 type I addiction module toxin, SymE family [Pectobacterium parmentieri]QPK19405.1 type I addiction module toxin, SymE family [Pectobacterium parmentieri]RKO81307.1 type I addiction module toxin, SymE family [Pectobacterium parmentieri]